MSGTGSLSAGRTLGNYFESLAAGMIQISPEIAARIGRFLKGTKA